MSRHIAAELAIGQGGAARRVLLSGLRMDRPGQRRRGGGDLPAGLSPRGAGLPPARSCPPAGDLGLHSAAANPGLRDRVRPHRAEPWGRRPDGAKRAAAGSFVVRADGRARPPRSAAGGVRGILWPLLRPWPRHRRQGMAPHDAGPGRDRRPGDRAAARAVGDGAAVPGDRAGPGRAAFHPGPRARGGRRCRVGQRVQHRQPPDHADQHAPDQHRHDRRPRLRIASSPPGGRRPAPGGAPDADARRDDLPAGDRGHGRSSRTRCCR